MAQQERLTVESEPRSEDVELLENYLNEFNMQQTGYRDASSLAIFVRGDGEDIEGGIFGFTWGGFCEIKTLWVNETRRRQGLGKRLLKAAEAEALARGCQQMVLGTYSF